MILLSLLFALCASLPTSPGIESVYAKLAKAAATEYSATHAANLAKSQPIINILENPTSSANSGSMVDELLPLIKSKSWNDLVKVESSHLSATQIKDNQKLPARSDGGIHVDGKSQTIAANTRDLFQTNDISHIPRPSMKKMFDELFSRTDLGGGLRPRLESFSPNVVGASYIPAPSRQDLLYNRRYYHAGREVNGFPKLPETLEERVPFLVDIDRKKSSLSPTQLEDSSLMAKKKARKST
jgi:hypothetical protein